MSALGTWVSHGDGGESLARAARRGGGWPPLSQPRAVPQQRCRVTALQGEHKQENQTRTPITKQNVVRCSLLKHIRSLWEEILPNLPSTGTGVLQPVPQGDVPQGWR